MNDIEDEDKDENKLLLHYPNYYNYKAKQNLLLYSPDEMTQYDKVYIFPYKVNNNYKIPFLSILLTKQPDADVLKLPEIQIIKQFTENELVSWSKSVLFKLLY